MADMVDLLNFDEDTTPKELYESLSKTEGLFCTPESATEVPAEKIPTTCTGPSVSLELRPKTCVLDSIKKTLVCDPAKLVLVKVPGECTLKYHPAFEYVGKECKITASIGLTKEAVIGGGEFTVDFAKTGATVTVADDPLVDVTVAKA
jgi:hypothetical protein